MLAAGEAMFHDGDLQRSIKVTFDKKQESKYGWMRGKLVAGNKRPGTRTSSDLALAVTTPARARIRSDRI